MKTPLLVSAFTVFVLSGPAWTSAALATNSTLTHAAYSGEGETSPKQFTGKIVSQNGVRFILRDEDNSTWYHLDNQDQAAKFLGKVVMVTGTLDGRSDMIRIQSIVENKP